MTHYYSTPALSQAIYIERTTLAIISDVAPDCTVISETVKELYPFKFLISPYGILILLITLSYENFILSKVMVGFEFG